MNVRLLIPALLLLLPAFRQQEERLRNADILEEHTRVTVDRNVAVKEVRLLLKNPTSRRVEAELFLEISPNEHVDDFRVTLGDRTLEGELIKGDKARRIYEEIVRQQKDPALLEKYGHNLLRIRVFPVEPRAVFEVGIHLTQACRAEGGAIRIGGISPLSRRPIPRVRADFEIRDPRGVGSVFSPTHEVAVRRENGRCVKVRYERRNAPSAGNLVLYASVDAQRPLAIAHDGRFMLSIPVPKRKAPPLPRDLMLVIDTSGSMLQDDKIGQVRRALKEVLHTLRREDRFSIISFATEARSFREGFSDLDDLDDAHAFIEGMQARGGTNMEEALTLAARLPRRRNAVPLLVFLTDGLPTIGERDDKRIRSIIPPNVRTFCFGVGYDVNTRLLDRLATETRGARRYLHPKEEVAETLTRFARRIQAPVLSRPEIRIEGATEIHPRTLPDGFEGENLVVYGRASGFAQVTLRAKEFEMGFEADFTHDPRAEFVPRLWAIQKIDYLLDAVRLNGVDRELVEEIVRLARRYMIVTPYTSYLIVEDAPIAGAGRENPPPPSADPLLRALKEEEKSEASGKDDWDRARNREDWRRAPSAEKQKKAMADAAGEDNAGRLRRIGSRNFVRHAGDNWTEEGYRQEEDVDTMEYMGEKWLALLRNQPELAPFLALGRNVTFRNGERWVRIR